MSQPTSPVVFVATCDEVAAKERYEDTAVVTLRDRRHVRTHKQKFPHANVWIPEANPCWNCGRMYKGQGSAYFGPACTLGDLCCTAADPAEMENRR